MSAIISEFQASPIATTSAAFSLILIFVGWGYTTFRHRFRDKTLEARGLDIKLPTSHGIVGDGLFLAIAVLLSVSIGTSILAQYAFGLGVLQGTFAWILLYLLTLVTVSVFVGGILKNWIEDNALVRLPKTKKQGAVAYLNDIEVHDFAKGVGFGIAGVCAFVFWMNSIEGFNEFLTAPKESPTAFDEMEQTFTGFFALFGTFGAVLFGGRLSGYLFRTYSGVSKFPLKLKEMEAFHWAAAERASTPP